jgi:hypothetical protein
MSHELQPPTHAFAACGLRPPALARRHGVLHSSRDATCRRLAERHGLRGYEESRPRGDGHGQLQTCHWRGGWRVSLLGSSTLFVLARVWGERPCSSRRCPTVCGHPRSTGWRVGADDRARLRGRRPASSGGWSYEMARRPPSRVERGVPAAR